MLRVGITGGIGSGKTIIGKLFAMMGIPVFSADDAGKVLLNSSPVIYSKLTFLLGEDIYLPNHTIDRKKLAALIFNNESLLKQVNGIIHPEVHRSFWEWSEQQLAPFVLYEAAILFESGHYREMDYNILVTADEAIRIQRVIRRDLVSEEEVKVRIANQWQEEQKMVLSDFVINNNERELVIPQVVNILKIIISNG